ncbi:putative bifunctional diguanylate cyclase/phosphodiesterase [Aeromonas sobria]|uniref:Diguanylate phosphodiesterase n=1 Tax=Aeromonas sobria TaxID=646 RepID=A0A2N3IVI9_AERSO|nr:GGDEF domain-containing phosphodiesterase [Aeromonas sobria]PKQ76292.1 diguanylate phosphodiesterase [Aeromonas sobria]TNH93030.1 diguanylate phosphodiesterase [Aeromonas sobria]
MRRALDSVYQIISSLAHSSGRGYFDTFVSEIAAAVMADVVLISSGALNDTHLTVQAAYPSSLDPDTLTLQLTTTPDAITWQEGEAWFSDRLLQLFPEMPLARQWQARAYVGIALKNADGETIGVCSLLYRQPQADMGRVMGLLRLLGPLAGRELALLLQRQLPQPVPDAPQVLQSMLFEAPVGIGKLDLTGRILWANPAIERMLGYSLDELLQRSISDINHPEDWQRSLECYQQIHRGECSRFTLEKRYLRKGGEILWGRVTVTLITDEQQQPDYLMVLLENIDPLKRHAEQLKLSHRVYDNLSEAILVCDADSRIISVNPAFEQITGYSGDEARGQRPSILKSGLHDQTFYADMYHALERVGVWRGEVWNKRKNGKLYPQQLMISTLREAGKIQQYIAIFSDLSQTKQAEQKIAAQANYDTLTSLPNRWLFSRCLSRFCERGERFSLMVLDLNNFKAVNNSMDHQAGDALLREVSDRLVSRVRTEDMVARIGGDEFAFLVPGIVTRRQAEVFAKQVIGSFARPFMLANQQLYVTATIGMTLCPVDGSESDELLRNAEQALFAAKRQGRLLGAYSATMREEVRQRHQMQQDLAEAIKLEQLTMAYQPIWDNRSGRVAKLEALVRWYHPRWGQVSPAEFIPLAEEAGLIQGLGALVLWQSCRDLARLQQSGFPQLQMSINRSTLEFQTIDPEASEWLKVIQHYGLDPADIVIEITESLLMESSDQHRVRIDALRAAGCLLAIDDFGTGYSALNYLRTFPVDLVKIDGSFVRHIPFNEQDRLLLDGIINIVHNLGMEVVIEGVETREQLNFLCQKGCAFTQGYLLSRPLAYDDLTDYLALNQQGMSLTVVS